MKKKWKRRQKCKRPNMALFWNQNISCWSLDRRAKQIKEKRRKRREGEEEEEREGEEKFKKDQKYGLLWVYMDFYG